MKKIISLFILVVLFSNLVTAAINPVVGTVIKSGSGVDNAYVIVNCNNIIKTTYSNPGGSYAVEYLDTECPDGTWVEVEATKGSYHGKASGKMNDFTVITIAIIDVFLSKIIEVIEPVIRKISIPHIVIKEVVKANDYLDVNVNVENSGNKNMRDATVSIVVPDLALRKTIKISKLKDGKDVTKNIKVFIPSDSPSGIYDARITIRDGYIRRVKHRSFRVV